MKLLLKLRLLVEKWPIEFVPIYLGMLKELQNDKWNLNEFSKSHQNPVVEKRLWFFMYRTYLWDVELPSKFNFCVGSKCPWLTYTVLYVMKGSRQDLVKEVFFLLGGHGQLQDKTEPCFSPNLKCSMWGLSNEVSFISVFNLVSWYWFQTFYWKLTVRRNVSTSVP